MGVSLLDGFIVLVVAGGLIHGSTVGAIRQVTSLIGFLVAFLVGVQLMHPVGRLVVARLGIADTVAPVVGFAVLFVGIQLLFYLLSRLVERVIETLSLSLVNRAAGGALGAFKAALLLSVLFLVLSSVQMPGAETRKQSVLYGPVAGVLPKTLDAASAYLPAAKRASETFGREVRPRLPSSSHTTDG